MTCFQRAKRRRRRVGGGLNDLDRSVIEDWFAEKRGFVPRTIERSEADADEAAKRVARQQQLDEARKRGKEVVDRHRDVPWRGVTL